MNNTNNSLVNNQQQMHRFDSDKKYDQVSGIFTSYNDLESLMSVLNAKGLRGEDISVLMSDRTRERFFAVKNSDKMPEGATTGAISGGVLGALIGGLTLVGSILIPGAQLLVAGPIVGAITGAAAGSATGGLIGALIGAGIPEHEAKYFEDALKEEGNVLVVAHVPHDVTDEVKHIFRDYGASQIKVN